MTDAGGQAADDPDFGIDVPTIIQLMPPGHPLHPAAVKLWRADEQAKAFHNEVMPLLKTAYPAKIVRQGDAEPGEYVLRYHAPELPIVWSVRVGEVIHNLRSSLDHMVWTLVERDQGSPGKHTAYPVFTGKTEFEENIGMLSRTRKGCMFGLGQEGIAMLRRTQPYHGWHDGGDAHESALLLLDELWNIDKHRAVPLVYASAQLTSIDVSPTIDDPRVHIAPVGPIENGAVLYSLPPGVDQSNVNVKANVSREIELKETGQARPPTRSLSIILATLCREVWAVLVMGQAVFEGRPLPPSHAPWASDT